MRYVKSIGFCLLLFVFALVPTAPASAARRPFTVLVDGVPLDDTLARRIGEIVIEQHASDADVCTITLSGPSDGPRAITDNETITVGNDLRVTAGGGQSGTPLFDGEITSIERNLAARDRATLQFVGTNRLHRLMRGKRTRVHEDMTDSDIASAIAKNNGLQSEADAAPPPSAYVLQRNESNLHFLQRRAARLGFNLWVEGTKLSFRAAKSSTDPADLALSGGFRSVRMTEAAPVARVTVRGWDPVDQQAIVGEQSAAVSPPGGKNIVFDHADALSESSPFAEGVIFSQAEADAVAAAAFRTAVGDSSYAELEIDGNPDLRPRLLVDLAGIGGRFDGKYLIVGCTHQISGARARYTTRFSVRRAAE